MRGAGLENGGRGASAAEALDAAGAVVVPAGDVADAADEAAGGVGDVADGVGDVADGGVGDVAGAGDWDGDGDADGDASGTADAAGAVAPSLPRVTPGLAGSFCSSELKSGPSLLSATDAGDAMSVGPGYCSRSMSAALSS